MGALLRSSVQYTEPIGNETPPVVGAIPMLHWRIIEQRLVIRCGPSYAGNHRCNNHDFCVVSRGYGAGATYMDMSITHFRKFGRLDSWDWG